MNSYRATDEYTRRGIETVVLENPGFRVEILAGKGGDISRVVDKSFGENILFEAPHRWRSPTEAYSAVSTPRHAFLDHYPGGWQSILPALGGPSTVLEAELGVHGESPMVPFSVTRLSEQPDPTVVLEATLTRFPLSIRRELRLEGNESRLVLTENVHNTAAVDVPYLWTHHIVFGEPLLADNATVSIPATQVETPEGVSEASRLPSDTDFSWPGRESTGVDLSEVPASDAGVLENAAIIGLTDGYYEIENRELGRRARVTFDEELFEEVWYWGSYGGYKHSPFFGREYALGLEPTTSRPPLEQAISEGHEERLSPGESIQTSVVLETFPVD